MLETIASWFEVFSNFWTPAGWGPMGDLFWPLNAIACAVVTIEAMMMLHLSHNRLNRLAYGLVASGAFTYFVGELGGKYYVVAPVETFFHWAIALGLASTIWRKFRGTANAPSY